jgi:hypothetical protein
MSKKSRKRNRKILGLLAAGLGAAALMKRKGSATAANVDSGRGGDSASAAARVAANTIDSPVAANVDTAPVKVSNWISPRMKGHGERSGKIGQDIRANYAKNARINAVNTAEGSPMIDNPYKAAVRPRGRLIHSDVNRFTGAKGGRVKGVGKAKRGFGRALKKGK